MKVGQVLKIRIQRNRAGSRQKENKLFSSAQRFWISSKWSLVCQIFTVWTNESFFSAYALGSLLSSVPYSSSSPLYSLKIVCQPSFLFYCAFYDLVPLLLRDLSIQFSKHASFLFWSFSHLYQVRMESVLFRSSVHHGVAQKTNNYTQNNSC